MKNKECNKVRPFKGTYSCDNYADVYIGNCHEIEQKIAQNSDLESVRFEAEATCNQFIYFVCWSDNMGLNGLLAELHGDNSILSGTSKKWEVFPTGINFDVSTTRPSQKIINAQLKKAHCKQWKTVAIGGNNDGSVFRQYKDIDGEAHFIWYDSGRHNHPNAPFKGFNHDEFLIFRLPIKELFKEVCYNCKQECECVDDCGCGTCVEDIQKERNVLKTEALAKTFVVKGDENNSRRCKAPYANTTCSELDLPRIEPCFYLHWGDSKKDQMENNDTEVLYITACNPYNNLRFRGLTITKISILYNNTFIKKKDSVSVSEASTIGAQLLANDTLHPSDIKDQVEIVDDFEVVKPLDNRSIQIVPDRLIALGDLCGCSCASQAVHMSIQNAHPSKYQILVEYCIDQIEINQDNTGKTRFPITIIKS